MNKKNVEADVAIIKKLNNDYNDLEKKVND